MMQREGRFEGKRENLRIRVGGSERRSEELRGKSQADSADSSGNAKSEIWAVLSEKNIKNLRKPVKS